MRSATTLVGGGGILLSALVSLAAACSGNVVGFPGTSGAGGAGSTGHAGTTGTHLPVGPGSTTGTGTQTTGHTGTTGTGTQTTGHTGTTGTTSGVVTSTGTGTTSVCDNTGNCNTCQNCAWFGPCNTQAMACDNTPECVAIIQCYQSCAPNDQTCYSKCYWAHPMGHQVYDGLYLCIACQQCYNDCNGAMAGCPPGG
jgi:hypothetical protein